MTRYAKCPYCGTRAKLESGGRLYEHARPGGRSLCPNYDQFLRPIINPSAAEVLAVTRKPGAADKAALFGEDADGQLAPTATDPVDNAALDREIAEAEAKQMRL